MPTLEELIPQFHEFIADRAEEIYTREQKRYPDGVSPNLKDHYLALANSAFERVGRGKILAKSKIEDPKQRAIEDAIARFDNSLLNPKKEIKGSYKNWQEAIGDLLIDKEFAQVVWNVREAYKGLMPPGSIDRGPYDKVVDAILKADNVALRMIYLKVEKDTNKAEGSEQSKLSQRYNIAYRLFVHDGQDYKPTEKTGELNTALRGPKEERILGKKSPEASIFAILQSILSQDTYVSKYHLYIEENDEGLVICDTSANGTIAVNYKLNQIPLKRKDYSNRDPLVAVIVPKDIEETAIDAGALFGGKNGKKYMLKIHLEK